MDPAKISCIVNRRAPTNVKELQIFLGCTNYYRIFINKFADRAKALFNLLKNGKKYEWSPECIEAFESLKQALTENPVLRIFDPLLPIILVCDASGYAASCILSQTKADGHEFVVAYADYLFDKHELNYTISEKECLAVVFGIKKFRHYVHGTDFTVITDHSALLWLNSISDPIGRLARWAILLQEYRFKVVHRKGSLNCAADAISRPVLRYKAIMPAEEEDDSNKSVDPWDDDYLLHYLQFGRHRDGSSKKQVKRCLSLAEAYTWSDNSLFFTLANTILPVPKPLERKGLILKAHALGHFGPEATSNALRDKYFWKGMHKDVERVCAECLPCIRNKKFNFKNHPALAIKVNSIGDTVSFDYMFGLEKTPRNHIGLVIYMAHGSNFVAAEPLQSKESDESLRHFWKYISLFGVPKTILTDNGTEFKNCLMEYFCNALGIDHKVTSSYNPRVNGKSERVNGTFSQMIRTVAEKFPSDWDLWIPYCVLAYNTHRHSTTNIAPYTLQFARDCNDFIDFSKLEPQTETENFLFQRANEIRHHVEEVLPMVESTVNAKQIKQIKAQNNAHTISTIKLPIGQCVYLKCEGILKKLEPRFKGPYFIIGHTRRGNYKLKDAVDDELMESYPLHKLKPVLLPADLPPDSAEVERICDHRIKDSKYIFLVKWKELDNSENSWVPEDHFDNLKLVKAYKKQLETASINPVALPTPVFKTRKQRKKKLLTPTSTVINPIMEKYEPTRRSKRLNSNRLMENNLNDDLA
jgi:hypothetical protein